MNEWRQPGSPEARHQPAALDQLEGLERPPATEQPGEPEAPQAGEQASATAATGHPAVDAALQAVRQAAHASPADQIPTYQAAHRTLRETLASIDES